LSYKWWHTRLIFVFYGKGYLSFREVSKWLNLSLRQTLEIAEKKIGENVGREEEMKAAELAKKLTE
jgi:hypothetical protein